MHMAALGSTQPAGAVPRTVPLAERNLNTVTRNQLSRLSGNQEPVYVCQVALMEVWDLKLVSHAAAATWAKWAEQEESTFGEKQRRAANDLGRAPPQQILTWEHVYRWRVKDTSPRRSRWGREWGGWTGKEGGQAKAWFQAKSQPEC